MVHSSNHDCEYEQIALHYNWLNLSQLPDDLITDYYFTVGIELTHYDSSPDPPPRDGKVYEKQVCLLLYKLYER